MVKAVNKLLFPTWVNLSNEGKTAEFKAQPWDWDVSADDVTRVRSMKKADRKKYMERSDISWNIYAAAKGENWFHPISAENVPIQILAFVADYDLPIEFEFVEAACRQQIKLGGWCPTHIETSLSKHIRCIWVFERPVLCSGTKFANEFLKRLGDLLSAEAFLPGIDRKSFDVAMRWTNGGYWHELDFAKALPHDLLTGLAIKTNAACSAKKADLPLATVATLLGEKFPRFEKFAGGQLKPHAVGIRFWDEKADNPNGAMVVERGFACVTGDKPLMTWEELLGKPIVDNLRATNYGEVADGIHFDGVKYWVKQRGVFFHWERADTLLRIASFGFDRSRKKDETMSPAEMVLNYIHNENRVDGAAPLLYQPDGIVSYQNNNVLNISRAKPMKVAEKEKPAPADFPWLWGFFEVFFAHPELHPRDYFFSWWRRFYAGAIGLKPSNGQAVFICGPQECGKNLISELILPMAMGGAAPNPYRYLMGDTDFSDDIFGSPILAINDEDAPPEHKRTIFEQKVKAMVANNEHSYHPKFMKKVRIEWNGRLVVTLNDGPKDVGLLPMLNPNTFHKMDFFKAKKHNHPFYDMQKNRDIVSRELPLFLKWLMTVYVSPKSVLCETRFGVNPFHDPDLVKINRQEQVSYNLLELLSAWMGGNAKWNGSVPDWSGSPTDLLREMTRDESLEVLLKNWDPTKMGRALGDLARAQMPGVTFDPEHKGRMYCLNKPQIMATVKGGEIPKKSEQGKLL